MIRVGSVFSEVNSLQEIDMNEFEGTLYSIGYGQNGGPGLTSLRMLPNTTVGVQVANSFFPDAPKLLVTLDISSLINQIKVGVIEFNAIKTSEEVSISDKQTVSISCVGVNSRSTMLRSINATQSILTKKGLKTLF